MVSPIQNQDFINWIMTCPGPLTDNIPYPPEVAQWLDGNNGALEEWSIIGEVMDAIFAARVDLGLEVEFAAGIDLGYDSIGCSADTVLAFNEFETQLINSELNRIKLQNQEDFLLKVIDYFAQDLSEANSWEFLPNDGPICRDNFIEIEQFLDENIEAFVTAQVELDELYDLILFNIHEGCELVDNLKFLDFITEWRQDEITDEIRALFLSEFGAEPFTDADQLASALIQLFYLRADLGLEDPVTLDLPPFADVTTCSIDTQNAADLLLDDIYAGLEIQTDLVNMEEYLNSILNWIIEANTPPPPPPKPVYRKPYTYTPRPRTVQKPEKIFGDDFDFDSLFDSWY